MPDYLDSYGKRELDIRLKKHIEDATAGHLPTPGIPHAFLLGGQSGAGKTTLQKKIPEKTFMDFAVINGDEYRKSHPNFAELNAKYGAEAVSHTAAWSGAMTEALIDELSQRKYNLIIEGTLRTSEVPLKTATLLKSRGYDVSLALMAVKPEISLVSCQIRYEMMRIVGTTPRVTDPAYHDRIVNDIVHNLTVLEQDDLFSDVYLYNRAGVCLFPKEGSEQKPSEVLRDALFGGLTEEEHSHLEHLQNLLQKLKQQ